MPQDFYIVSWQLSDIFWLKSNLYPEREPVMTNNTLTQDVSFIKIFTFWDINSIILQNLYLSQLICTNNHLRKSVDSICCYYLANNYYYIIQFKWFFFFFDGISSDWIWFSYTFDNNHLSYYLLILQPYY